MLTTLFLLFLYLNLTREFKDENVFKSVQSNEHNYLQKNQNTRKKWKKRYQYARIHYTYITTHLSIRYFTVWLLAFSFFDLTFVFFSLLTAAMAQLPGLSAGHARGRLGVRIPTAIVIKTGSDSSTVKHSAIGKTILGDDHYKRMSRVIVGVALLKDHKCRALVKICSPTPVMVTSQ